MKAELGRLARERLMNPLETGPAKVSERNWSREDLYDRKGLREESERAAADERVDLDQDGA